MIPFYLHELLAAAECECSAGFRVTDQTETLSNKEIGRRSGTISAKLRDIGIERGDLVAVHLPETATLASAIAAISKIGGIAVPLADSVDANRVQEALRRFRPRAVVHRGLPSALERLGASIGWSQLHVDDLSAPSALTDALGPIDLDIALGMLTSGSTAGAAKMVGMSHNAVIGACESIARYLEICSGDQTLMYSPASFDYGLYQLFISALRGASVYIPSAQERRYPSRLAQAITERNITILPLTPAPARQLIPLWAKHGQRFEKVRKVTFTGSGFPSELVDALSRVFPQADIVPMYGITEAKRCSFLPKNEYPKRLPSVGVPIPNSRIRVVDQSGVSCPENVVGEIELEGRNLMTMYIDDCNATAHRILERNDTRRLVTGDLGYIDRDGYLFWVGRNDDIVKISDKRISLAEIEAAIRACPEIVDVSVVAMGLEGPLAAFLVAAEPGLDLRVIARSAATALGDPALVPQRMIIMASLPLTHHGKVDVQQLRATLSSTED